MVVTMTFRGGALVAAAVIANFPVDARADGMPGTVVDVGLSFSAVDRGGDALNSTGLPDEFDSYEAARIDGRLALPISSNARLQFGLRHEENNVSQTLGTQITNDSPVNGSFADVQLGIAEERKYFGAFYGVGQVSFNNADSDQNADFSVAGLSGAVHLENWSFGAQVGRLTSSASNLETLDDAHFLSLVGQYYFKNDRSSFGVRLSGADGMSDNDDAGPDPADLFEITLFGEHVLDRDFLGGSASVVGGVSYFESSEKSSTTGLTESVTASSVFLGIRIKFNAKSPKETARRTAFSLPDFETWLGHVPALD